MSSFHIEFSSTDMRRLKTSRPLWQGLKNPKSQGISMGWVCHSCSQSTRQRRLSLSKSTPITKPYYVTTPIFYVNAAPHIGHLYSMVLSDIMKRWQVLCGRRAILSTGIDEHGMKIQRAAAKAECAPKEFCDRGAEIFRSLAQRAEISNDYFVRTTDPDHREAVQHVWHMLEQRGYIYQNKHQGWYSVSDETFYPVSAVHLIVDPPTGRKMMASIETGKEVEWTSEENYHFKLSAFKDRLLAFYNENPDFIVPKSRMSDVVQAVSEGLEDLSISRPVERLSWGIPVPSDPSQTIYVWLDALINYITKAGYPWAPGQDQDGGWPADLQVIGKDIIRFHCIYWPAFLLALDIPLPKQILTHAHWTLGRQKMAKSTGNGVNPFFAIDRFGIDTIRYYLAHDGGIKEDADYANEFIVKRYKKDLQETLGNLTSRIVRGKGWNVRNAVKSGVDSNKEDDKFDESMNQHQKQLLETLPELAKSKMLQLDPGAALKLIMSVLVQTNKYLQHSAPWALVKKGSGKQVPEEVNAIIFRVAETLRICGILLQPYMPSKANELLDMLGVDKSKRSFDNTSYGGDESYGKSQVDLKKGQEGVLFPPLLVDS